MSQNLSRAVIRLARVTLTFAVALAILFPLSSSPVRADNAKPKPGNCTWEVDSFNRGQGSRPPAQGSFTPVQGGFARTEDDAPPAGDDDNCTWEPDSVTGDYFLFFNMIREGYLLAIETRRTPSNVTWDGP